MTLARRMNYSTRERAEKNLATHSFIPKQGYIEHGNAPLAKPGPHPHDRCAPPQGAPFGSEHYLQPPGKHPPRKFRWIANQRVWAVTGADRMRAHRLGFSDTYLSRAGWTYLKPAIAGQPLIIQPPKPQIVAPAPPAIVRPPKRGK
jgi:hypothetical protein